MAASLTGSDINTYPIIITTDNKDKYGKNWGIWLLEITAGASNDGTTFILSTANTGWGAATACSGPLRIKEPMFVEFLDKNSTLEGVTVGATIGASGTTSTVTLIWGTAPTNCTYRIKIEGYV